MWRVTCWQVVGNGTLSMSCQWVILHIIHDLLGLVHAVHIGCFSFYSNLVSLTSHISL